MRQRNHGARIARKLAAVAKPEAKEAATLGGFISNYIEQAHVANSSQSQKSAQVTTLPRVRAVPREIERDPAGMISGWGGIRTPGGF